MRWFGHLSGNPSAFPVAFPFAATMPEMEKTDIDFTTACKTVEKRF